MNQQSIRWWNWVQVALGVVIIPGVTWITKAQWDSTSEIRHLIEKEQELKARLDADELRIFSINSDIAKLELTIISRTDELKTELEKRTTLIQTSLQALSASLDDHKAMTLGVKANHP